MSHPNFCFFKFFFYMYLKKSLITLCSLIVGSINYIFLIVYFCLVWLQFTQIIKTFEWGLHTNELQFLLSVICILSAVLTNYARCDIWIVLCLANLLCYRTMWLRCSLLPNCSMKKRRKSFLLFHSGFIDVQITKALQQRCQAYWRYPHPLLCGYSVL